MISIREIKDWRVIYGYQEVGSIWIIQAKKLRICTYGCKIYCDESLEAEWPRARTVPYAYELEAENSVTWRIERAGPTWVDQPIKELFRSSVGGLLVYSDASDARMTVGPDPFVYTHKDFIQDQSGAITSFIAAGGSPQILVAPAVRNIRIEGFVACTLNERAFVAAEYSPNFVDPPYIIGRYWHPSDFESFQVNIPAAQPIVQWRVIVTFGAISAPGIVNLAVRTSAVATPTDDLSIEE